MTEKKEAAALFFIALAIAIGITGTVIFMDHLCDLELEEQLDQEELHYDADWFFILIDRESEQAGYYEANRPICHIHGRRIPKEITPGVYLAYPAENGLYFTPKESGAEAFILTLTDAELEYFDGFPAGTPSLVR